MQYSIVNKCRSWALAVGLALCAAPSYSDAIIVDNRSWSGTSCGAAGTVGSGDCYGATYSLLVNDRGDVRIPSQIGTHSAGKMTLVPIQIGTYSEANRHPCLG